MHCTDLPSNGVLECEFFYRNRLTWKPKLISVAEESPEFSGTAESEDEIRTMPSMTKSKMPKTYRSGGMRT